MVQTDIQEVTMKKVVVILIFILLLVFFLQLNADRPDGEGRGKEAITETKSRESGTY